MGRSNAKALQVPYTLLTSWRIIFYSRMRLADFVANTLLYNIVITFADKNAFWTFSSHPLAPLLYLAKPQNGTLDSLTHQVVSILQLSFKQVNEKNSSIMEGDIWLRKHVSSANAKQISEHNSFLLHIKGRPSKEHGKA